MITALAATSGQHGQVPVDDKIRVLWLTKGLGPGGAERLLLSFARLADLDRFDIHAAYLLPWKDHLVGQLESAGVTVHCLDGPTPTDPRWIRRLRRLVVDERIDVIHNHSPLVAAQARVAMRSLPRTSRPRVVGTEHNMWGSHNLATRVANRLTIGLEDHTFAVSDQVQASMSSRHRHSTEVLIHGIDIDAIARRRDERDQARARFGLDDTTLCVVTVANLRSNKDYPTMLTAARILRDGGSDTVFLAVGQGPLEDELVARRDDLGLEDSFRFLGYQEDPVAVLAAGDLFCLSSRFEGLSIALLEAMAMGLPVVATKVGGTPHVVSDGVQGSLVEPGEPARLAEAIQTLENRETRRAMAIAAIERSREFGAQRAVDRQQQMYEHLT